MKGVKQFFTILILIISLQLLSTIGHTQPQKNQPYTDDQKRLIDLGFQPNQEESYEETVMNAQRKLKELGYYTSYIDGIIGPKTTRGLMGFQHDLNLSVTGELDAETRKYLSKVTLILNTQDFAPFHYRVATLKNQVFGPVPEAIRATCIEADINCILRLYDDWGEAQELVKQNKAHGMFVIGWNADRAKWLHRSMPIIETEYGVFVRNDSDLAFEQLSDLDGYTIGVYGPSNTSKSLSLIQNTLRSGGMTLNVNEMRDDKPLFRSLSSSEGKYGVYSNKDVGATIISGMGLDNIRYAGTHKKLLYYIGFSKNMVDPSIVDRFNQAFTALQEKGIIQEVYANSGLRNIGSNHHQAVVKQDVPPEPVQQEQRYQVKILEERELIEDKKTCLMWQKNGSTQQIDWNQAKNYIETLNQDGYAGYSDWRLPDLTELSSLLENNIQRENRLYISSLFDAMQYSCWSNNATDGAVQFIDFYEGVTANKNERDTNFVRAVRGESCIAAQ